MRREKGEADDDNRTELQVTKGFHELLENCIEERKIKQKATLTEILSFLVNEF